MGVWNTATPAGTDAARDGDDRIREMKAAIEEALSHEYSTFPGATPASTPIFIPGFLRGATGSRPTGDSLVEGRLYINTTLGVIERYNGSSWDAVAGGLGIASGTVMVFYQAAAPTGWTAVAVNDKFLRVVSAGGTGGTTGGSGLTPSSTITLAHTHTVASHTHTGPSHTHSTPNHTHVLAATGGGAQAIDSSARYVGGSGSEGGNLLSGTSGAAATIYPVTGTTDSGGGGTTGSDGTGNTGSASPATDSQLSNTAFQYADLIIATKD